VDERAAPLGGVAATPGWGDEPIAELRFVVRVVRSRAEVEPAEEVAGPPLDSRPEAVAVAPLVVGEPGRQVVSRISSRGVGSPPVM